MAAINGTALLLHSDGQVVALQKGVSITVDTDLPDATNKESAGWAQHIQGQLNAKIDFSALFSTEVTAGMGANALMDYIINRQSLLISILGMSFPIVAEVDISSLSFDAPSEGAMSLSGSMKVKGQLYCLRSTSANMITDPDAGGVGGAPGYSTLTVSGNKITLAAVTGGVGTALCYTNALSITDTYVYKLITFLQVGSGSGPTVGLYDSSPTILISNSALLAAGLNIITLTAIGTDANGYLRFSNTDNCSWATISDIYLFRV